MEKIKKFLIILLFSQSFAQMDCSDLPGVWWGKMQDKTKLMLDGPVPVILSIEKYKDQYIGQFKFIQDVPGISSKVWVAQCDHGVLINVYLVDPKNNFCGISSNNFVLKDELAMVLNWQNAMIDTQLEVSLVPLQKKVLIKTDSLSKILPETCH